MTDTLTCLLSRVRKNDAVRCCVVPEIALDCIAGLKLNVRDYFIALVELPVDIRLAERIVQCDRDRLAFFCLEYFTNET